MLASNFEISWIFYIISSDFGGSDWGHIRPQSQSEISWNFSNFGLKFSIVIFKKNLCLSCQILNRIVNISRTQEKEICCLISIWINDRYH